MASPRAQTGHRRNVADPFWYLSKDIRRLFGRYLRDCYRTHLPQRARPYGRTATIVCPEPDNTRPAGSQASGPQKAAFRTSSSSQPHIGSKSPTPTETLTPTPLIRRKRRVVHKDNFNLDCRGRSPTPLLDSPPRSRLTNGRCCRAFAKGLGKEKKYSDKRNKKHIQKYRSRLIR